MEYGHHLPDLETFAREGATGGAAPKVNNIKDQSRKTQTGQTMQLPSPRTNKKDSPAYKYRPQRKSSKLASSDEDRLSYEDIAIFLLENIDPDTERPVLNQEPPVRLQHIKQNGTFFPERKIRRGHHKAGIKDSTANACDTVSNESIGKRVTSIPSLQLTVVEKAGHKVTTLTDSISRDKSNATDTIDNLSRPSYISRKSSSNKTRDKRSPKRRSSLALATESVVNILRSVDSIHQEQLKHKRSSDTRTCRPSIPHLPHIRDSHPNIWTRSSTERNFADTSNMKLPKI